MTYDVFISYFSTKQREDIKYLTLLSEIYYNLYNQEYILETYIFLYFNKSTRIKRFFLSKDSSLYSEYCNQLNLITSLSDFFLYDSNRNIISKIVLQKIFINGYNSIHKNEYICRYLSNDRL